MRRQTRKLLLNVATGVAIAATAAVMLIPASVGAGQLGATAFGSASPWIAGTPVLAAPAEPALAPPRR